MKYQSSNSKTNNIFIKDEDPMLMISKQGQRLNKHQHAHYYSLNIPLSFFFEERLMDNNREYGIHKITKPTNEKRKLLI